MPVVNYIVAHKLFKEQNSDQIDEKFAEELIVGNPGSDIFVTNFKKAHTIRAGILHGRFINDISVYPVQGFVGDYLDNATPEMFLEMSKQIGYHLRKCLRDDKRSAGGYLIVFDYTDEVKGHIIAIALMNDKANSGIDAETLKFTKSMTLDLQHMHVATTIIIDRLLDEDPTLNHLTFMSGLRHVSELYKKTFIGCDNAMLSAKATNSVMGAVEGFLKNELGYDDTQLKIARDAVVDYFEESPQEVTLQEIQNRVFPSPEDQARFEGYVDEQQYELSASFKPNKSSYKSWKKFYYKGSGIIIDIDPERVHDGTVDYSNERQCLIINDSAGILYDEYRKIVTTDDMEE